MKLDETSLGKIMEFIARRAPEEPVIFKEKTRIRIKDLRIEKIGSYWAVKRGDSVLETFSYRSWAVAYAMALATNNSGIDGYLADAEKQLSRLLIDKELYDHHMEGALKRNDITRCNILEHRMSRADRDICEVMDRTNQVVRYQRF